MKIAEVWVNLNNLPTEDVLSQQALKTKKYSYYTKEKALTLIAKEIKESGLYNTSTKRVKKSDSKSTTVGKPRVSRKRKLDKGND